MPAITSPPTSSILAAYSAPYAAPNLNPKQRLAILIQAKIVLLNYKGGTNYIGMHSLLTSDSNTAFAGMNGENWGFPIGDTEFDGDPGPVVVGSFVTQANFRDSVNMPATLALILPLLVLQMARPMSVLQKQNVYLDYKLLAIYG